MKIWRKKIGHESANKGVKIDYNYASFSSLYHHHLLYTKQRVASEGNVCVQKEGSDNNVEWFFLFSCVYLML
jgi:hypothetical protein